MENSQALLDAYHGIEVSVGGRTRRIPPLGFSDGLRFTLLTERFEETQDPRFAWEIYRDFPRAVGLEFEEIPVEDLLSIIERCLDTDRYALPAKPPQSTASGANTIELDPTWEDHMADFVACYGSLPRPRDPWPLFLSLLNRAARYEIRRKLTFSSAVLEGLAAVLTKDSGAENRHRRLVELSFPTKEPVEEPFHPNILSEDAGT